MEWMKVKAKITGITSRFMSAIWCFKKKTPSVFVFNLETARKADISESLTTNEQSFSKFIYAICMAANIFNQKYDNQCAWIIFIGQILKFLLKTTMIYAVISSAS